MLDALNKILGFFETLWEYVTSFFESVGFALDVAADAIALPLKIADALPDVLTAGIVIVLAVCMVKFVIGR